ncbi:zf-RING-2 multi-domain protein [Pyrenophora teres f. maculata]|nr:zf-RING-2 multi-domain protein [Pyrenophora teres f. maculata]
MFGSGNDGGQRAPFTGGIWGSSLFRRSGRGGGASHPTPQHANLPTLGGYGYVDEDYSDNESPFGPMRGGMGPMGAYGGGNTPLGQSFSHTSYQDSDGNVHEQGYGPGGSYSRSMGPGQMYMMSGGAGPAGSSLLGGRRAGGISGPFMSAFWMDGNSVRGPNGRGSPAGFSGQERGLQPDGAFAFELDPAPLPRDNGLSEDNAMVMAEFMQLHTQPVGERGANAPPNSECPICLEPPSQSHLCVQIKGVPGCNHMIGRDCLEELLIRDSDEKKECPLCRAEFLASNFIEQGSDEWNQLAQGRGGAQSEHAARRGPRRGPPGGMSNMRGLGDVGMGGQGGSRPMARDPRQGNLIGSGQRLGGAQSGYYQQQYAPNYGDGMGYNGGAGRM